MSNPPNVQRALVYGMRHAIQGRSNLPGQLELAQTDERPAELAKIKAAEPLKPASAQKPMDIGLFSDDAKQTSLI